MITKGHRKVIGIKGVEAPSRLSGNQIERSSTQSATAPEQLEDGLNCETDWSVGAEQAQPVAAWGFSLLSACISVFTTIKIWKKRRSLQRSSRSKAL